MDFKFKVGDIISGLTRFADKSKIAIDVYADTAAKKLESEAKGNAPWTDDTGLSRKTIEGGKQWEDENKCSVFIAGNTEHFPYLELAHDKKYAILQPTIDKLSSEILRGLENILK